MSSIEDENLFKQITEMPMRVPTGARPAIAEGNYMRCPSCGTGLGQRFGDTLLVDSNKTVIGNIPLSPLIYRRCRGGKANPKCRQIVTLPTEWLPKPVVQTHAN